MTLTALDLFAGTGWGVACHWLGIEEIGVELMPEARATREVNGMRNAYADVWEGLDDPTLVPPHALLIASPPCQTFSMAGKGAGRGALDEVLGLIDSRAYLDPAMLRAFGEKHDPRTALVLTPLAYVAAHVPMYVVLEQVPTVLPVWQRMAEVLREWGYSVVVGILNAEQYGVPQTRKRAILIARADGAPARMPTPTHSAYYSRNPSKLDPDVEPWVSMAEALGWDSDEAVGFARLADDKGAATEDGYRARDLRPAGAPGARWATTRPATSVMGDPRVFAPGHKTNAADEAAGRSYPGRPDGAVRVTTDEAAALQSYPPGFIFSGTKTKQFLQVGNAVPPLLAHAVLSTIVES